MSVEFVNIFAENSTEHSLPNKQGADILLDIQKRVCCPHFHECDRSLANKMSFKSTIMAISWAVFSPEDMILLVCVRDSNMLHPFMFREGTSNAIMRLSKFEVEMGVPSASPSASLCDTKNTTVMERDVVIMCLYNSHYIGVIRNTLQPGQGAEVLLYQISDDNSPVCLTHLLMMDISGSFTLSVVEVTILEREREGGRERERLILIQNYRVQNLDASSLDFTIPGV